MDDRIDAEINRLMEEIANHQYGDEVMDKLQRQLHSLQDLKNKIPKKRTVREWFWDNSKTIIGCGVTIVTTAIVVGNEHTGPILSKAFGFISKPKII